jgi:RimJ/RimL family protein N-acetyltransferase
VKEAIFKTVWELKKQGYAEATMAGYCSEAVKIMGDYLFLSKNIVRIQAHSDARNLASERVLEKAGARAI